jgi:hypothetical protein
LSKKYIWRSRIFRSQIVTRSNSWSAFVACYDQSLEVTCFSAKKLSSVHRSPHSCNNTNNLLRDSKDLIFLTNKLDPGESYGFAHSSKSSWGYFDWTCLGSLCFMSIGYKDKILFLFNWVVSVWWVFLNLIIEGDSSSISWKVPVFWLVSWICWVLRGWWNNGSKKVKQWTL